MIKSILKLQAKRMTSEKAKIIILIASVLVSRG
jgi:hypothetical protein